MDREDIAGPRRERRRARRVGRGERTTRARSATRSAAPLQSAPRSSMGRWASWCGPAPAHRGCGLPRSGRLAGR